MSTSFFLYSISFCCEFDGVDGSLWVMDGMSDDGWNGNGHIVWDFVCGYGQIDKQKAQRRRVKERKKEKCISYISFIFIIHHPIMLVYHHQISTRHS